MRRRSGQRSPEKTPEAQAREFLRAAFASFPPDIVQGATALIAELIREAENEALERAAAAVACMRCLDDVLQTSFGALTSGQRAALLVRALKHPMAPLDAVG